jgi:hypothetical protein
MQPDAAAETWAQHSRHAFDTLLHLDYFDAQNLSAAEREQLVRDLACRLRRFANGLYADALIRVGNSFRQFRSVSHNHRQQVVEVMR